MGGGGKRFSLEEQAFSPANRNAKTRARLRLKRENLREGIAMSDPGSDSDKRVSDPITHSPDLLARIGKNHLVSF
jgi:hypothetical protein